MGVLYTIFRLTPVLVSASIPLNQGGIKPPPWRGDPKFPNSSKRFRKEEAEARNRQEDHFVPNGPYVGSTKTKKRLTFLSEKPQPVLDPAQDGAGKKTTTVPGVTEPYVKCALFVKNPDPIVLSAEVLGNK